MTQWGSKDLADQGYSAIDILRNFYGYDIYLAVAEKVAGIPSSFPEVDLQVGSSGAAVRTVQEQLNKIAENYPAIPKVRTDGIFGADTLAAVKKFQQVFDLSANGIVDYPTWYKISEIFVAVAKLS